MALIIGVSGDQGSFSEEAALLYAKQNLIHFSLRYLIDMEGVLSAIEQKEIDLGVFPIVNLQGGLVKPALQAMGKHLFYPIDDLWLNVKQCLLGLPETQTQQIKKIVSHPQGLAQCKQYLLQEFPHAELSDWCDTAKAAKDLAQGTFDANTAVIAPERSAEFYGLKIIAKDIQDNTSNLTAFVIVKNREYL